MRHTLHWRRARVILNVTAACSAGLWCVVLAQNGSTQVSGPRATVRLTIAAAVTAMGVAECIRAVRNLMLIGYAQYAYQNGGGNISPLPGAPQKYIAANDYRRIYDLAHGRTLHWENGPDRKSQRSRHDQPSRFHSI